MNLSFACASGLSRRGCPGGDRYGAYPAGTASAPDAFAADGDFSTLQLGGAEGFDDVVGEVFGDLDEGEAVGDVDVADLAAGEAGLAGDGADEVLGADAGGAAGADVEAGHRGAAPALGAGIRRALSPPPAPPPAPGPGRGGPGRAGR